MIYLDMPLQVASDHPSAPRCFRGRKSAHLMADTTEELLAYAKSVLGMPKQWLQKTGTAHEHFDLTGWRLERAQQDIRVTKIDPQTLVELIRSKSRAGRSAAC
jgi:hypothetical protein